MTTADSNGPDRAGEGEVIVDVDLFAIDRNTTTMARAKLSTTAIRNSHSIRFLMGFTRARSRARRTSPTAKAPGTTWRLRIRLSKASSRDALSGII